MFVRVCIVKRGLGEMIWSRRCVKKKKRNGKRSFPLTVWKEVPRVRKSGPLISRGPLQCCTPFTQCVPPTPPHLNMCVHICVWSEQSIPWLKEKGTQLFPHNKQAVFAMQHDCSVEVRASKSASVCNSACVCVCVHPRSSVNTAGVDYLWYLRLGHCLVIFCEVATHTHISLTDTLLWVLTFFFLNAVFLRLDSKIIPK